jgi:hypothetical protein
LLPVEERADNEEVIMRNRFLIGVATAALISSVGLASAQTPSNAPNAPAASQGAGERTTPLERGDSGMKGKAEMPREGGTLNAHRTTTGIA